MKTTVLLIFFASIAALSAQPRYTDLDTFDYLPHRYYTPEWYADCPAFLSDTNDFTNVLKNIYSVQDVGLPNVYHYANEYYVDGQVEIKGLMCLVCVDIYVPRPYSVGSPDRAPEWLTLVQGGAMLPGTGLVFPREMTIVDSLRWDTARPYVVRLPRWSGATADSDFFLFYAYDVYFPTPVVLDSAFYVAGSLYSNLWQLVSSDDGQSTRQIINYPTSYGCIGADYSHHPEGMCDACLTTKNRMFDANVGFLRTREEWWETWYPHNHYFGQFRQLTGPMFAIVDLHSLTLNSADPEAGTVSGGGDYPNLSTATATAHPAQGHTFMRWSDGSTDNPRSIQMTGDVRLVAFFR